MRPVNIGLLVMSGFIAQSSFAGCQDPAGQGNLVQQLQATYVATVMEPNGMKVAQPGCTLVVQVDGLVANPAKLGFYGNNFEDGQVKAGGLGSLGGWRNKMSIPGMGSRPLAVGEKVYLLRLDVKDNQIVLDVQTCGSCDPAAADPAHKPFKAAVSVHFQKGFMAVTDLKHVEDTIGGVLAFDTGAAASDQGGQAPPPAPGRPGAQQAPPPAAAPPTSFAPIVPPPPPTDAPPPQPKTVALGQTPDQVKEALGQPSSILKPSATKMIYIYKDLKVTFVKDKVSDIQ